MKKVDVVVIGAGPAGIGTAVELVLANKAVAVLEKGDDICQTLHKFYKDGKRVDKAYKGQDSTNLGHIPFEDGTKESTLHCLADALKSHKIEVELGCEVESVRKNGASFVIATSKGSYECDFIVVAIGRMGKPNRPDYKIPATIASRVNFNANSVQNGEKIAVVGGGNSAAEYAVELAKSCTVTLCYRQKAFTRLNDINLSEVENAAKCGKITLDLGRNIISLDDEGGKVKLNFDEGQGEVYDRIIYAIGGSTPVDFLQKCGIKCDEAGVPIFDENKQSNVAGIFVAGDIATKNGASIVVGLNDGVKIADFLRK